MASVQFEVAASAPVGAATLRFFAFPNKPAGGGTPEVLIEVNGHMLPAAVPVKPGYTGWVDASIPAGLLTSGLNTFIFAGTSADATTRLLFIDECYNNMPPPLVGTAPPIRSAKSFDGGATWHTGALGNGTITGEYVVRLALQEARYNGGGVLISPVLDAADPNATGAAIAPAGFAVSSVAATLEASAPKGTSVTCEVRYGSTPAYHAARWSLWASASVLCSGELTEERTVESKAESSPKPEPEANTAAGVAAAAVRFVQWRVTLRSSSGQATPTLSGVTLTITTSACEPVGQMASSCGAPYGRPMLLRLASPSAPLARSGWPFVYMVPHPAAERLAAEMRLQAVLDVATSAGGPFHFPGFDTDFCELVALRTWAHAQWTGWMEGIHTFCPTWSALDILATVKGNWGLGQCTHFAAVFVGFAASLGFAARSVVIGGARPDSGGHCLAEAWVPSLRKWVLMDAGPSLCFSAHYLDATTGTPLSLAEMHDRLRLPGGAANVLVVQTVKFNEPPVTVPLSSSVLTQHDHLFPHAADTLSIPCRNDYTAAPELSYGPGQQGWLGYHYGGLLHYAGPPPASGGPAATAWHVREDALFTSARLADFYPSVGETRLYAGWDGSMAAPQSSCASSPSTTRLSVRVETTMPNWAAYEMLKEGDGTEGGAEAWVRVPSTPFGEWSTVIVWEVQLGKPNTLAVRALSRFGVAGPAATITVTPSALSG